MKNNSEPLPVSCDSQSTSSDPVIRMAGILCGSLQQMSVLIERYFGNSCRPYVVDGKELMTPTLNLYQHSSQINTTPVVCNCVHPRAM